METKDCLRCREALPVEQFSKHRGRPDGLQAYCKGCYRSANRTSEAKNRARTVIDSPAEKVCGHCRLKKSSAEFYKDRRRADGLYANCKLCHYKLTHQWQKKNPTATKAIQRRNYDKNAEARRAAARAYRAANLDASRARVAAWKRENRAQATAHEAIRRARKFGAPGVATPAQIAARVAYFGHRCWMCGAPWEQIDHVKPIAAGGPNWPSNLRPACASCNGRKNNRWPYVAA